MHAKFAHLFLALAGPLACAPAHQTSLDAAGREQVEQAVSEYLEGYREALAQRDTRALRALLVADGRFSFLEDGTERYPSPDALMTALDSLPPTANITTENHDVEILVLSDTLAYATGHFRSEMEFPGSPPFTVTGMHSSLIESVDGQWRLVRGHTSSVRGRPD